MIKKQQMNNYNEQKIRILKYIDYKGINKNKFYNQTGISIGTLDKKTGLTVETIVKLHSTYNEINLEWLITGKGPMLRGGIEASSDLLPPQNKQQGIIQEPQEKYIMATQDRTAERGPCWEKDLIIEGLKTQLAEQKQSLEARLADKDKQIEALERLIASKDEMLAMKEEAVKGKEEIISIQSKRIAELEAQKDTEEPKKILGSVERIGQEGASASDIRPKDLSARAKKSEYQP